MRGYFARITPVERPGFGHPGQGLPGEPGGPPDWGLEEGAGPDQGLPGEGVPERPHPRPPQPPGIWPPLEGPSHPIYPIGPEDGGEHPWEPGEVWPPIRPPGGGVAPPIAGMPGQPGQGLPKQLFFALVYLTGYGFRWVVVDLNAIHRPERPDRPAGGPIGRPPDRPGPGVGAPGQGLPQR